MSGYLKYQRKVNKERATDFITRAGAVLQQAKGASPKQLVYPQDLFSPDCLPFILFFAVDPVTPSVLLDKIALYMPRDIQVNYSLNYGEATNLAEYVSGNDVSGAASALMNPMSAIAAAIGVAGGVIGATGMGGRTLGKVLGGIAGGALGAYNSVNNGSSIGQTTNINQKNMLNPHKAALFEGVNFRRHNFQFELIARNAEESDTINEIIHTFKLHAHPEAGNADDPSSFMKWPSAWQIGLYSPARKYLYAISTCHITNIHVNYTSGGTRAFYSDTGAPVAVRLNLEFMETEWLTRERILQGY
jgi:hypothetical protein